MTRQQLWGALVLAFAAVLSIQPQQSDAQGQDGKWSEPKRISDVQESATKPFILTDNLGTAHAFWPCSPIGKADIHDAICYANWHDGVWSKSNDIVFLPTDSFAPMATLQGDRIHLVDRGGWYTQSSIDSAWMAQGWSSLSRLSSPSLDGDITADSSGIVHFVYSYTGDDVFYIRSEDSGQTWSSPVRASRCGPSRATDWPQIAIGRDQTIHLAWTEFDAAEGFKFDGVYYARSDDGGWTWTPPLEVAGSGFGSITVAAIDDEIHLAWNAGVGEDGRHHQWSSDGGRTWKPSAEVATGMSGGISGFPDLAFDSAGVLHMTTSTTYGSQYGIFHLSWADDKWSEAEFISGQVTGPAIEEPQIAVGSGNQLHVVFRDGSGGVWHTTKRIDSPELLPPATPTTTREPIVAPAMTTTRRPTVTQPSVATTVTVSMGNPRFASSPDPNSAILISVLAVGVLIGSTTILKAMLSRRP